MRMTSTTMPRLTPMTRSVLLSLAFAMLLPGSAFAATTDPAMDHDMMMGNWPKTDAMPMGSIPVIINYQITSTGARIYGLLAHADKEVEIFDNGVSLGKVDALMNNSFSIEHPKPLDPTVDHRISVRGWDMMGNQVTVEKGPAASGSDGKEAAIMLTRVNLEQQKKDLQTRMSGEQTPTASPVSGAPSLASGASQPGATDPGAAASTSRMWFLVLVFVVVLTLVVTAIMMMRKRKQQG